MAARLASVGRVAVAERRSMGAAFVIGGLGKVLVER
jgi:hypothetical protein